jgi:hypothetical protein
MVGMIVIRKRMLLFYVITAGLIFMVSSLMKQSQPTRDTAPLLAKAKLEVKLNSSKTQVE